MTEKKKKSGRVLKRILLLLAVILFIIFGASVIYVNDYYHADSAALEMIESPEDGITVSKSGNTIVFRPEEEALAGFIFYPGAKVQYEAYAPLMTALAERGIMCVLVHMPGNFAFMNINAAAKIIPEYPEITTWYAGGHSLGGAMASICAAKHADEISGVVLCAAFSTADLGSAGLRVLSVYGSEDGVLELDKYEKYRKNLPEDFTECIIEGGCHSWFGYYGIQNGDGTPTITREEMTEEAADAIAAFCCGKE